VSFLSPWALLLGALAGVPLLLHLLRRRTGVKVDFPAVRYLLRAEREHAKEVRLRNLLLMLLRVGIVLAIALAVARPVGPLPGFGHPPTAVALVLDNSASSAAVRGDGPVLRTLVQAARDVVDAASSGDLLFLVTMDGDLRSGDATAMLAALDSLTPMDGAGDAASAMRRADAVLASAGVPERRVIILTDAQASQWRAQPNQDRASANAFAKDSASAARTLFAPQLEAAANRGIIALEVEPPFWSPRGGVRATLVGDSASWRLELEGRSVTRGRTEQGGVIVARAQGSSRGWQRGLLALEGDEYRLDDQRHFAVHVGDAPALITDGSNSFLREAVASLVQSGRARAGNGVFVGTATRARQPALLFAPQNPLQVADANRALAAARIPWRFGERRSGPAPLRGEDLDGATATSWYTLERSASATDEVDTLARVGAAPWAVAGDDYVLVASAADADATDIFVRADFVPWLDRLVGERLTVASGVARDVAPTARVTVPVGVTAIELPDGSVRNARAGDQFSVPSTAGVYFWRRGAARAGALVVNPEASESDLLTLTPDSLSALVGVVRAEASPSALARAAFAASGRRALDSPLLLTALLLLIAESWLARRGRAATANS
jgi:hypothetical protein